jgi:hypothetical protein
MTDDKGPKSSYELAMERFKKRDDEAGIARTPPTEAQKAAIAQIKSFYQAKLAELEILHQGRTHSMMDHAEREAIDKEYQRERERLSSQRDAKTEAARQHADQRA